MSELIDRIANEIGASWAPVADPRAKERDRELARRIVVTMRAPTAAMMRASSSEAPVARLWTALLDGAVQE